MTLPLEVLKTYLKTIDMTEVEFAEYRLLMSQEGLTDHQKRRLTILKEKLSSAS